MPYLTKHQQITFWGLIFIWSLICFAPLPAFPWGGTTSAIGSNHIAHSKRSHAGAVIVRNKPTYHAPKRYTYSSR